MNPLDRKGHASNTINLTFFHTYVLDKRKLVGVNEGAYDGGSSWSSRLLGPFGWPQSGPHQLLEERLRAAFARALRSDFVGDFDDLRL